MLNVIYIKNYGYNLDVVLVIELICFNKWFFVIKFFSYYLCVL